MKSRTRYGLILGGFLFFLAGAPILVFYVQGKAISFNTRQTELTGIIAAETEPSNATLLVNDIPEKETPGAVRFLANGDYAVRITKAGYRPWQKTLSVVGGKVTWVNPNPDPLVLLKDSAPEVLAEQASKAVLVGKNLVYIANNTTLVVLSGPDFSTSRSVRLVNSAETLIADPTGTYVLAQGPTYAALVDTNKLTLTDLSKPLASAKKTYIHKGQIWMLANDHTFMTIKPGNKTANKLLPNVSEVLVQNNELYYTQTSSQELRHALLSGTTILQDQLLTTNVPSGKNITLFVDTAKAVYALVDTSLWRMNETPSNIAHEVLTASTSGGSLAYTTPGQLWWYNSSTNKSELISRSGNPFGDFYVNPSLQYALFAQGQELIALELNDQGSQNKYVLDRVPENEGFSNLQMLDNTKLIYSQNAMLKSTIVR